MKDDKIIDINGTPQQPVEIIDNTYSSIDEVLAAGKRLSHVTNAQLIYLRDMVALGTPDYQLVTGEWAFRVGRQQGDTTIYQEEETNG
ncbi:hypothetical protein KAR91_84935, partial [Candidatus Pacearchaeota archaeon]|nr:hypothetical protein [Candidatus Pacearchaeota archaeon]